MAESLEQLKRKSKTPKPVSTITDPIKIENLSEKLYGTTEKVLAFCNEVMDSKEQIEIKRYTKVGEVEKYMVDKYTPDHKLRVAEIIIPKVFADKKDTGAPGDPLRPTPVSFNFVPITKKE